MGPSPRTGRTRLGEEAQNDEGRKEDDDDKDMGEDFI